MAPQSTSPDQQTPVVTPGTRIRGERYDGLRGHGSRAQAEGGAAQFLPSKAHDLLFTTVHSVVSCFNPTSAAPVAYQMRIKFSDAEVFKMLEDVHLLDQRHSTFPRSHGNISNALKESRMRRHAELYEKTTRAHVEYAAKLRDQQMCDVDVIFHCDEYQVEPFRSERQKLEAMGGKSYHLYPFREKEKEMAVSVIVPEHVLGKLYPPDVLDRLKVTIKINTAPAPFDAQAERATKERGATTQTSNDMIKALRALEVKSLEGQRELRVRSDSILKVVNAPKEREWMDTYSQFKAAKGSSKEDGTSRGANAAPAKLNSLSHWNMKDAPFRNDPKGDDDHWWQADWNEREQMVSEWNRRFHSPPGDDSAARNKTENNPSAPVKEVERPCVAPLSNTYVDNGGARSLEEHRLNSELRNYEAACARYADFIKQAEKFYYCLSQLRQEVKQFPYDQRRALQLREFEGNRMKLWHELQNRKSDLLQCAKACDREPESADLLRVDTLEARLQFDIDKQREQNETMLALRRSAVAAAHVVNTPRPDVGGVQGAQHQRLLAQRSATAPVTAYALNSELEVAAPSVTQKPTETTIPFPAYVDPMGGTGTAHMGSPSTHGIAIVPSRIAAQSHAEAAESQSISRSGGSSSISVSTHSSDEEASEYEDAAAEHSQSG